MTPDELKKPGFRGGATVLMADGQEWTLPRLRTLFVVDDSDEVATLNFDIGRGYDDLYAKLKAAEGGMPQILALIAMIRWLFLHNYTLSGDDLRDLLRLDFSQPEEGEEETDNQRIARELEDIALGRVPPGKPSAVG